MNSLAIVEQDIDGQRIHYVVTLISNVLRENSAHAHQTLGTQVHELMLDRHRTTRGRDQIEVSAAN